MTGMRIVGIVFLSLGVLALVCCGGGLLLYYGDKLPFFRHERSTWEEPNWPAPIAVTDPATSILRELSKWQAASDEQRVRAAHAVAAATREFEFLGLTFFGCGEMACSIPVFLHPRTGLEFSLVPAGTFEMGPDGDLLATERDTPAHQVTLTRPFFVCRTSVTVLAWDKIPSYQSRRPVTYDDVGNSVRRVSWMLARDWCIDAGLSLPSEAEWEYAARAGTRGPWYFPGRINRNLVTRLEPPAYFGPKPRGTTPTSWVARTLPNAFGLHDTFHTAEWVRDGFADYSPNPTIDPDTSIHGFRMYRGSPMSYGITGASDPYIPVWRRFSPDWDTFDSRPIGLRPLRHLSIDIR